MSRDEQLVAIAGRKVSAEWLFRAAVLLIAFGYFTYRFQALEEAVRPIPQLQIDVAEIRGYLKGASDGK